MMPDAGITITPANYAQCTAFDAVSCHAGIGDAAGGKLHPSRRPRPTMPIMATAMIQQLIRTVRPYVFGAGIDPPFPKT
jgi:hypothetical protein